MSKEKQQDFSNHSRLVIGYHVVTFLLILVNMLYALYSVFVAPSVTTTIMAATGVGLLLLFYYARAFSLGNQDRIIRLEERLRFDRLLSGDLRTRAQSLSVDQLVAIRFASDDELESLVRKVLDEGTSAQKDIKALIRNWRPDHERI